MLWLTARILITIFGIELKFFRKRDQESKEIRQAEFEKVIRLLLIKHFPLDL